MNYLNFNFSPKEEIISFPFNNEILLVATPNNVAAMDSIIAVNDAGFLFWEELIKGSTPNQICRKWAKQTGIEISELQNLAIDLLSILKPLLNEEISEDVE